MNQTYTIQPLGDSAVTVSFGNEIRPDINHAVTVLRSLMEQKQIPGIVEFIPTYTSLTICYRPESISYRRLTGIIRRLWKYANEISEETHKIYLIPVCYGGEYGADLARVSRHTGLTEEEIIQKHASTDYLIYMLGFLPGFSYLGGLDEVLHTPRLKQPRTLIPVGSVGIGGSQTGIYPLASPGGWNLIGRTPVRPYDAKTESILYKAGDYIRFVPIDEEEYQAIEKQVLAGTYVCPYEVREDV